MPGLIQGRSGMTKQTKRKTRERLEEPEAPAPEQYGARPSLATVCVTCGHPYLKPCTTMEMVLKCPNAKHLGLPKPKGKR